MTSLESRAEDFRADILREIARWRPIASYGFDPESMERIAPTQGYTDRDTTFGGLRFKLKDRPNYEVEIVDDGTEVNIFVMRLPEANSVAPRLTRAVVGNLKLKEVPRRLFEILQTVLSDPV